MKKKVKTKSKRVRGSLWSNKKYGKTLYRGKYRTVKGEREFILVNEAKPKDKVIPFNHHAIAKQALWKKVGK